MADELMERRATFEAIRGTDEEAVRVRFAVLGLTPERMGEAEHEAAVRDEVRRLELMSTSPAGSTSTPGGSPGLRRMTMRPEPSPSPPVDPAPPRPLADCAWCGDARMVTTTRDPRSAAFGQAVPCPRCVSLPERAAWAGIPSRFAGVLHGTRTDIAGQRLAHAFAGRWDFRRSVVIAPAPDAESAWGTGKTHLACLMLLRALEAGQPGRFLYASDFLDAVKARFGDGGEGAEAYAERQAAEPLLVLDDLGAERGTDWQREQLRTLVDRRYRAGRTTVITTNARHPADLGALLGGAVASRLRECAWVWVSGGDLRGQE